MASRSKRVGFVCHDLDNFHSRVFLKNFHEILKKRKYTVEGCFALNEKVGKKWAKEHKLPYYEDPKELNEVVDYFMVLAPNNPESHYELCKIVFPFGKHTYVDKTFAPDLSTAKQIFKLADKHKIKIQSSSALRYTGVQDYVQKIGGRSRVQHMVAWGAGRSYEIYAIHPVELVVSCMGVKAEKLMRRGSGKQSQLLINFSAGRTAVVNVYCKNNPSYMAAITSKEKTEVITVDTANLFTNAANSILDFFDSGKPTVDKNETLLVRRILDVAMNPKAMKDFIKL